MEPEYRMAEYDKWCNKCEHEKLKENEFPCNTCLAQGWNENSSKPFMWKEKDKK